MSEKYKILILDDEDFIRDLICEMLTIIGHEPESASMPEEALKKYKKAIEDGEPFDFVIFDINLKGDMNGYDTLTELKKIDPNVKAIAATGFITPELEMAEIQESTFDIVINKPYSMSTLQEAVQKIMSLNR